ADYPPSTPVGLPAERLGGQRVKLNWSRSIKRGGGASEYRVRVYADRAATELVLERGTAGTARVFDVPQAYWVYHIHVADRDSHRQFNPQTWYPAGLCNFVLSPVDQYGWYGVL